ncbi:MAG: methyltransferase domain-containing protein [Candidatus Aenigmatarchaeota archaeon]
MEAVDNIIANIRYRKVLKFIKENKIQLENKKVVDLGGGNGYFKKLLIKQGAKVTTVDIANADVKADLNKRLPFEDKEFDIAFSLAVVEHLYNPYLFLEEMKRISYIQIGTTPHKRSKRILDFLASINVINKEHIKDHKIYLTEKELNKVGYNTETFEFGMNILFYRKLSQVIKRLHVLYVDMKRI